MTTVPRRQKAAASQRADMTAVRLPAVVAAAAAVVDLFVLGLLHVVSPEVNPVTRPVSEYALGDFEWLATIRTLAQGVGPIALAVALRRERAGAVLLLVVGILKLAMPLFPVDALGAPATSAGQIHDLLGNLTFFLFPMAALLLLGALRRRGSRLAPLTALLLAIATIGVLLANAVGGFGLAQRAYLVLCGLWLLLAALAVLRNLRTETR
jgi:hypothetical protein